MRSLPALVLVLVLLGLARQPLWAADPALETVAGTVLRVTETSLLVSVHDKGASMGRWRFRLDRPLTGLKQGDRVKVTFRRDGDQKVVVQVDRA